MDIERHALDSQIGATDALRYGMALIPHMKVRIAHGLYDLVTPYFASDRIATLMYLSDEVADNLSLEHYRDGHTFYAWTESRRQFALDASTFCDGATVSSRR
ncbi:MAG: hypothetical protein V3S41_08195 [Spirochaetia bacterium]